MYAPSCGLKILSSYHKVTICYGYSTIICYFCQLAQKMKKKKMYFANISYIDSITISVYKSQLCFKPETYLQMIATLE